MSVDASTLTDTAVALVAALFGGAGVKMLDKMLSKRNEYFIESKQLREELVARNIELKQERDDAVSENNEWKSKYWAQMEESVRLIASIESLEHEVSILKAQVQQLLLLTNHSTE